MTLEESGLKALEKDRARRYSSASELGADVGRYLNSLPVVAGPPSASYRAKKFVRRHRVGVAVGVTLGLALLVGSVGTTWGMLRAIRAEARAKDEATVATQLSDFLIGVFSGTNPLATAQDAKGDVKGPDLTAIELLRRGALRVRAELDARPLLQARLMGVMGMAFIELGATDSARPLIEDSLRLSQHDALSRAEGLVNLGHLKLEDGSASFGEVEVLAREALAVFTANDAEAEPGSLRALQLLAATLRYQDRLDEAIGVLYQRLGILERSPAGNEIRIAEALRDIAFQKVFKGELQQSTELLHRALELLESSVGPNHPSIGSVSTILGWVSVLSGRWDEAEVAGERALRIAEEYLGPTHVFVADALDALGSIYALEGKYREATEANDRCIQIKRSIYGQQTPKVAVTLQNSAWVRMKSGDYGAAERMYLEAFGLLGGLEKIKAPIFWKNFAALLCLQGRLSEAEKHFEVALAQAESWGPEHPSMVWVLNDFAQLRVAQGRLEDAEALTDRSVELAGKLHGQSHQDLAWGLHNRAAILLERGRFDQAEAMGRSALRMREDTLGASHPDVEESRRLLEKIEKLRAAGRTAPAKLNK